MFSSESCLLKVASVKFLNFPPYWQVSQLGEEVDVGQTIFQPFYLRMLCS